MILFILNRFQLFKDVIICLSPNDKAKEEMLSACRQFYRGNHRSLKMIDDFDKSYHPDECIGWYTRETFIYQLINKALRTEDIEQIYMFRFYIADLSKQLAEEHKKMQNQSNDIIDLYRGTIITKKEAETIKMNRGKVIATNGYWSTSRNRSYAMTFAKKWIHRPDMIPILFEIKCHLCDENNSVIFADISHLSGFIEEKEVLFDLGATFTIEEITEETTDDIQLLIITIKTNGEGRKIVQKHLEENRKEMIFESPTILLCNLLQRMGKSEKSFYFLQYLFKNPANENLAHINNRLGIAFRDRRKYQLALNHFDEAIKLISSFDSSQQGYLPFILHNKGLVYAKTKEFYQALQLYQQAQEILQNDVNYNHYVLAHLYNSIGRVYFHLGHFDGALHYQFKALFVRGESSLPDHLYDAVCYIDIANIYSHQGDYKQALEYHLQALNIRQKDLPANHHNIVWSLHQIGRLYHKMDHSQLALQFYLQSLQIHRQCQSDFLSTLVIHLLDDIVSIYIDKVDLSLEYQLEAMNIQRQMNPINYFLIAYRLDKIAFTYKSMNNLNDSLNYYREALETRLTYLSNNCHNLARSFHNLASVYDKMKKKKNALTFYNKAMSIFDDIYPRNHWLCQKTRANLERIKQSIE
jgi:tetratricopeptide (TPR) repeat protein